MMNDRTKRRHKQTNTSEDSPLQQALPDRSVVSTGPALTPLEGHDTVRSDDQSPDLETQASLSSRFGHDFSQVSIYADTADAFQKPSMRLGHPIVQRQADDQIPTADVSANTSALLAPDASEDIQPTQMHRSDFLAQVRTAVENAADEVLAGTSLLPSAHAQIDIWLHSYEMKELSELERAIYADIPEAEGATTADELLERVCKSARIAIVTQAADQLRFGSESIDSAPPPANGEAPAGAMRKSRDGSNQQLGDAQALQAQLGAGQPLDNSVQTQMESVFEQQFGQVRLHTDAAAAALSNQLNARAFTIGSHIAFGAGEYQPGTPTGDALLAHELTHVVQQGQAGPGVMSKGEADQSALEQEADTAAVGAVLRSWAPLARGLGAIQQAILPRLKTGLRLSRCATTPRIRPTGVHYDQVDLWGVTEPDLDDLYPTATKDSNPERDEILNHLEQLNAGGVYVFFGHAKISLSQGRAVGLSSNSSELVSSGDMRDRLAHDHNPPTLVVLGACQSESILDDMLAGGVPVAVGFSDSIGRAFASEALQFFMQALSRGRTFVDAKERADQAANAGGTGVAMRFADDYHEGMTLADARRKHMAAMRGE
jgi:hypothetical protein